MNRPKTHRWLGWYCAILIGGAGATALEVYKAVGFLDSEAYVFLGVILIALRGLTYFGLLFRKLWAWRLNFAALFLIPVIKLLIVLMCSGMYGTYDVTTLGASAFSVAIFWLVYAVPNAVYFGKRKYLFDNGRGSHKLLFKGFRVLDSQGSGAEKKSDSPAVVSGSNERSNVPKEEDSVSMNDDAFYDQVAEEIETGNLVRGVWTRAFAEADGDENRAKAIYIKLRVKKLFEESRRQGVGAGRDNDECLSDDSKERSPEDEAFVKFQEEEKDITFKEPAKEYGCFQHAVMAVLGAILILVIIEAIISKWE